MKQMIKIIRKVDIERERLKLLELDLDYQLATLYYAMQKCDNVEIDETKKKLTQIQQGIEELKRKC